MADIESLTRYVKKHPYHFVERWRLVKKIYKTSDYELALEHLLVLDEDWEPKASLTRYLAATYSRLERLDDAVKTLEKGIAAWPKDLEMLEQLAMVYQKVGREEDAIKTLEKITKIDPNYRLPQKAKESLRHEKLKGHHAHTNVYAGLTEETVCARCGAQNTNEVTQCWQCKANLDIFGEIVNQPQSQHGKMVDADPEPPETLHYITLALKCLIGVFTVFGGYQTYQTLAQSDIHHSGYTISTTFEEWIGVEMVMTRIVLGVMLLVLSPFLLQGAYRVAGAKYIELEIVFVQSMVFSTLLYALTWVPGIGVFGIVGVMVLLSFFIIAYPSWKEWSTIMIAYCMYWVLVGLVLVSTFMAVHGVSALQEIPAVMRYSSSTSSKSILNIQGSGPIARDLQWYSTGSEWLDEKFVGVEIHIKVMGADPEVLSDQGYEFEFKGDNDTLLFYQTIHSADMMLYTDLTDFDVVYTILLTAESAMEFEVDIIGLTPVKSLD